MGYSQKLKLSHYTPWRRLGEKRYSSYSVLTSALDGGEWSASRPGCALAPGKGPPSTHSTAGWVCLRAGLDTEARGKILLPLPEIEPRLPSRPVRSQTLYWLDYPGSRIPPLGIFSMMWNLLRKILIIKKPAYVSTPQLIGGRSYFLHFLLLWRMVKILHTWGVPFFTPFAT
jgi:hypothetical protein